MASVLNNIQVASPCHEEWGNMQGDERVRHCQLCKMNVFNISAITREEAEKLISERQGRLCVRYYVRKDNTIITNDCPVGKQKLKFKRYLQWGTIASLLLMFLGKKTVDTFTQYPTETSQTLGKIKEFCIDKPCDFISHKFGITSLCHCKPVQIMGKIAVPTKEK